MLLIFGSHKKKLLLWLLSTVFQIYYGKIAWELYSLIFTVLWQVFVFGRKYILLLLFVYENCKLTNKLPKQHCDLTNWHNQIRYKTKYISGGWLVLKALFPSLRSDERFLFPHSKCTHCFTPFRIYFVSFRCCRSSSLFEWIVAAIKLQMHASAYMQWHFRYLQSSSIIIKINCSPNETSFRSPLQIFTLN